MAEEKILVTDLVKEVGSKALSLVTCEPFIQWVLEAVPMAIEHDAAAILLADSARNKFYLRLNQPLPEEYVGQFKAKVIESFDRSVKPHNLHLDIEMVTSPVASPHQDEAVQQLTLSSFHYIPLVVRDNVLGVFAISSAKPDLFLVFRVNMFNIFANQVSLGIDSLLAREQVVKQARIIERDSVNMKTAFAGMSEGLIMTDEADIPLLLNPTAKKMLGIKEDMAEKMQREIISSMLAPVFKELANQDKKLVSRETELDKPHRTTLRIDATPAHDSKGRKIGAVIILRDITSEKEIDRLKTEFISTVSHELRTPLTTIRESVSQVLDGILGPTTAQQQEFLSICLEDIDRLTRIINDLLDISQIEAKKVELKREVVDIAALVKGIALPFASRFKEKELELKISLAREALEVFIDKDKIIQVFTNLVGNSLKFTEKGYIEIAVAEKEDCMECSVFDTGRGIAEDDLPKVFSKFQQFGRVDGPGEKGTGLGLSIAKGIVEMHHGKIWIESRFGEWTRFSFTIPKYCSDEIIREHIEKRMAESKRDQNDCFVYTVKFAHFEQCVARYGKARAQKALFRLLEVCKHIITDKDFIAFRNSDELFLLVKPGKYPVQEIKERLNNALKQAALEAEHKELEMHLTVGHAVYPKDADNADDLLALASRSLAEVC
jgi:PAS domain S-box-containing protein